VFGIKVDRRPLWSYLSRGKLFDKFYVYVKSTFKTKTKTYTFAEETFLEISRNLVVVVADMLDFLNV